MKATPSVKTGFVSTNSISQGEQVGVLWKEILGTYKMKILFAHQTFKWTNEAKGVAAVHCIIVAFAQNTEGVDKFLFEYENIAGEPTKTKAKNINPYLVEGKDVFIDKKSKPISNVPEMNYGSMPIDEGFLILSDDEKVDLLKKEPNIQKFIRQYTGGDEFINNKLRWCFWLKDFKESEFKTIKFIDERLKQVKSFRESSSRPQTLKLAETPHLFGEIRQPNTDYLLIPKVSSENRDYIPIGFYPPKIIASGSCLIVPNADLYYFGILTSKMHMAWVKYVCGRMKSDYQYSASIVYNNYPFPENVSAAQKQKVETAAQAVLDSREIYTNKGKSLADLYDPLSMPPDLKAAHDILDKAVDDCYGKTKFTSDAKRVGYLFELYDGLVKGEKKK